MARSPPYKNPIDLRQETSCFIANPPGARPEFRKRFIKFYVQQAAPGIKDPIVFFADRIQLGPAQPKGLSEQPFRAIAVMGLAYRLLGRRNANAVHRPLAGQNEYRHKTALDTPALLVNTKKLGAFKQPSFLG